ncbi:MAG: DNA-processing protein DprA [Pseudomonadota bacterium]
MEYDLPELLHVPDGLAEAPLPVFDAPPAQEELFARLHLIRCRRVGPATWRRLVGEYGSARAALAALPDIAAQAGDAKYTLSATGQIRAEIAAARKAGARLLTLGAPGYPAALADVADAPPVLWAQGKADMLARPAIALVGTRNASSLALRMARALGRDLAAMGYIIVSGLARGVDAVAHEAALAGGTIAVHAGGLDQIYPEENRDLGHKIATEGCALSERPFGLSPQARDFPRRNRIVSGLSLGVVVVEAAARSGTMLTARNAIDQGRDVMAVPGHPLDTRASGCNMLLRDGATLIRSAEDIAEVVGGLCPAPTAMPEGGVATDPPPSDADLRARILGALSPVPVDEDQVIRDLLGADGPPHHVLSAHLSELELTGQIRRAPGGGLVRV